MVHRILGFLEFSFSLRADRGGDACGGGLGAPAGWRCGHSRRADQPWPQRSGDGCRSSWRCVVERMPTVRYQGTVIAALSSSSSQCSPASLCARSRRWRRALLCVAGPRCPMRPCLPISGPSRPRCPWHKSKSSGRRRLHPSGSARRRLRHPMDPWRRRSTGCGPRVPPRPLR